MLKMEYLVYDDSVDRTNRTIGAIGHRLSSLSFDRGYHVIAVTAGPNGSREYLLGRYRIVRQMKQLPFHCRYWIGKLFGRKDRRLDLGAGASTKV